MQTVKQQQKCLLSLTKNHQLKTNVSHGKTGGYLYCNH